LFYSNELDSWCFYHILNRNVLIKLASRWFLAWLILCPPAAGGAGWKVLMDFPNRAGGWAGAGS
jgi:hypothetical protein